MSTQICAGIDEIRAAAQLRVALDKKPHWSTPPAGASHPQRGRHA